MAKKFALGLMSGTSADGVSLALVEGSGHPRVCAHATYAYSPALRERILSAPTLLAAELSSLNFDLGRIFARSAVRFLKGQRISARFLTVVGSHGQTVVHSPQGSSPSTLQMGEPAFLAEVLGVPVVSDFRPRDMAAGGQGAPIVPFLDELLFGKGAPVILQNIGGIGNAALVGRGVRTRAFDTGPGNSLIDLAIKKWTRGKKSFDQNGAIAAKGSVDLDFVSQMMRHSYFKRKPPKSLDRGTFSEEFYRRYSPHARTRMQDEIATWTYFIAASIVDAYKRHLRLGRVRRVIVSGGGALNSVLMGYLQAECLPLGLTVCSIDAYGIPVMAKEPAAMAVMALYALRKRSNHSYAASGAIGARILGKITQ